MKANQKGFSAVKALLLIVVIALLGLLGWYILRPKKNTPQITQCSTAVQTDGNESFQLPAGWNWHDIKETKVRYAYPSNWQSPTDQTNSGDEKYVTSYTLSESGTEATVTLNPGCSDFQPNLSAIINGTFDTADDKTTTKAIRHDQSSYSSMSHWSTDSGNQYQLTTYRMVSVGPIRSVVVDYSVIAGSEVCPDDRLAGNDQPKCLTQTISDEVDQVISSLQKLQ